MELTSIDEWVASNIAVFDCRVHSCSDCVVLLRTPHDGWAHVSPQIQVSSRVGIWRAYIGDVDHASSIQGEV